jgi:predicted transcriptional regulator
MADEAAKYVELTSDIVAAYVSKNHAQIEELPSLIASVHGALQQAATGATATEKPKPEPVVPPNKSVRPDHIVCLFDGKKFKSLKRHIRVSHGMTPQQYREAFDLTGLSHGSSSLRVRQIGTCKGYGFWSDRQEGWRLESGST